MEIIKVLILIWIVAVALVVLIFLSTRKKEQKCPECGTQYSGDHCPKCTKQCSECECWYKGERCPKCYVSCTKCGTWYRRGTDCPKCVGSVPIKESVYATENDEYAAEHNLWVCKYCETLNQGGGSAASTGLHGRIIRKNPGRCCVCCGKTGAKILEKRSIEYVL